MCGVCEMGRKMGTVIVSQFEREGPWNCARLDGKDCKGGKTQKGTLKQRLKYNESHYLKPGEDKSFTIHDQAFVPGFKESDVYDLVRRDLIANHLDIRPKLENVDFVLDSKLHTVEYYKQHVLSSLSK